MKSHDYQVKEYEDDPKHLKMINQILNKLNNSKNIPWQYSYLLECAEIARSVQIFQDGYNSKIMDIKWD